ncbi:MAG TPA: helix-turn-helix domain-containing protein [Bacteroidales bacterium]|nr:helix-turn-helix domain-containing protein [Bacteroidales bacterium]
METSKRIYLAARREFLMYGYHASSLNRIAGEAGVLKPSIHYYFRTKKILYEAFVTELVTEFFDKNDEMQSFYYHRKSDYVWFLLTEMHNNRPMLLEMLNKIDRKEWKTILIEFFLAEHQSLTMIFKITGQSLFSLNTKLPVLSE